MNREEYDDLQKRLSMGVLAANEGKDWPPCANCEHWVDFSRTQARTGFCGLGLGSYSPEKPGPPDGGVNCASARWRIGVPELPVESKEAYAKAQQAVRDAKAAVRESERLFLEASRLMASACWNLPEDGLGWRARFMDAANYLERTANLLKNYF